jgi:hypothetical protein
MMWQNSYPNPSLRALLLLDLFPDERRSSFWHLGCLQDLASIIAFVDTSDCSVMALEFRYNNDDFRTIGNPTSGGVRLSYYFTKGEVILSLGCAKAKNNPGIAIKVFQSCST